MELRWYQKEAVDTVWTYLRNNRTGAPCVVLPTGAGKTPVLATLCKTVAKFGGRALVLAHVKELLQQAFTRVSAEVDGVSVGLYSAGLGERTTDAQIVIAGIQSVYQRAEELGPFQLIIVDEAHLIPDSGDGMYRTFLEGARRVNPDVRLVGLTATPYRLGCGWICGPDRFLTEIVYEVGVRELIAQGFLSPLKSRGGKRKFDVSGLHIRGGEFVAAEVDALVKGKNVLESACAEIVELTKERKKVLVFCPSVDAAKRVEKSLKDFSGARVATITGETNADERAAIIDEFKRSKPVVDLLGRETPSLKYLVNVNVLTTGFDAPNVDCVVLLRPTNSVGLYQQMVGRGLRLAPDKTDCLVLDYGQNVVRLGPIDMPTVATRGKTDGKNKGRECPNCCAIVACGHTACPECGELFPAPKRDDKASSHASDEDLVDQGSILEYDVDAVYYEEHEKKGAEPGTPRTLQVSYEIAPHKYVREWCCVEHTGWMRQRFEEWWRAKSKTPPPKTARDAADYANAGALATPLRIRATRKPGKKFPEIEWIEGTEIPDFTLRQMNATAFDDFAGFDDYDDAVEPTPKPRPTIRREPIALYGVCAGCLNYSFGYCAAYECEVGGNEHACDQYVLNNNDIPF
ncbi:MAG: DEAD/DEAH box helicase [Thermoguttaceae bacterium]|nr:DEAD/DEAH box helicase [Thermoguttaceae bacterium]